MARPDPIIIVGGGITGLAAAYYARTEAGVEGGPSDCLVLEKEGRAGGTILTETIRGYVIEGGPDCFLSEKRGAIDLCRELGIEGRLLPTDDHNKGTFVLWKGRLHELPEGVILMIPTRILPFLRSGLISLPGKIRMGLEVFLPRRRDEGDESLGEFIRRRFGAEALVKIGEPLVAGVHAGDPETMSMRMTFPRFLEMEKSYGSLIRGMLSLRRPMAGGSSGRGAAVTLFMSLRDGLGEMVSAVVRALPTGCLRTGSEVVSIERVQGGYEVMLRGGNASGPPPSSWRPRPMPPPP